ncbi:MAG: helix-turn-helix domain-containing protein [Oscillospiraceae bacterium]
MSDRIVSLPGNTDQKQLTDYLGLKAAFTEWKSDKSNSYLNYLMAIADFFHVSLDYLAYGKGTPSQFTEEQSNLLSNFDQLKPDDNIRVMERAEALAGLAAERAAEQQK